MLSAFHRYEHPYKIELELYQPPTKVLEPDTEPPTFPKSLEDTPLSFIETVADLEKLVEHLNTVDEIAVDVEHHSYRTYQGIVSNVQDDIKYYVNRYAGSKLPLNINTH